jgi:hypothetical protein
VSCAALPVARALTSRRDRDRPSQHPRRPGTTIRRRRAMQTPRPDLAARPVQGLADLDQWCKEIARSPESRRWYRHAPSRFREFREFRDRYLTELGPNSAIRPTRRTSAASVHSPATRRHVAHRHQGTRDESGDRVGRAPIDRPAPTPNPPTSGIGAARPTRRNLLSPPQLAPVPPIAAPNMSGCQTGQGDVGARLACHDDRAVGDRQVVVHCHRSVGQHCAEGIGHLKRCLPRASSSAQLRTASAVSDPSNSTAMSSCRGERTDV